MKVEVFEVDRDWLLEDEVLLKSVYSVLAVAHYRVSPNDLQMMLEAKGHRVLLAMVDDLVAGALEAVVEPRVGGRGVGIVPDVFSRIGWGDVGPGYRVVRIAVAPCVQGRGVGRALVGHLEDLARREGLGWVAASFGHYEPLGFWLKLGFVPVHVSPRFNPATGEKNIIVFKPLREVLRGLASRASCSLLNRLVYSGSSIYRDMPAEVVTLLLRGIPCWCRAPRCLIDEEDLIRLRLFIEGRLAYESVHDVLLRATLLLHSECMFHRLGEREAMLVALLVVQGKPVYEAEKLLGVEPRAAEEILRAVYARAQSSGHSSQESP